MMTVCETLSPEAISLHCLIAETNQNAPSSRMIVLPSPFRFHISCNQLELPPHHSLTHRSIAVTTTLPASQLEQAGPALIRPSIAGISLEDILTLNSRGPTADGESASSLAGG